MSVGWAASDSKYLGNEMAESPPERNEITGVMRIRTFTRWVNKHLGDQKTSSVQDLCDVALVKELLDNLTTGKYTTFRRKYKHLALSRPQNVVKFLKEEQVQLADQKKVLRILSEGGEDILEFLELLLLHYNILVPLNVKDKCHVDPRYELLKWLNNQMAPILSKGHPEKTSVSNFDNDWRDGYFLGALMNSISNELCRDWHKWDHDNGVGNTWWAMETAERNFKTIKMLLKPCDMCCRDVDDVCVIAYLAQFIGVTPCDYSIDGYESLPCDAPPLPPPIIPRRNRKPKTRSQSYLHSPSTTHKKAINKSCSAPMIVDVSAPTDAAFAGDETVPKSLYRRLPEEPISESESMEFLVVDRGPDIPARPENIYTKGHTTLQKTKSYDPYTRVPMITITSEDDSKGTPLTEQAEVLTCATFVIGDVGHFDDVQQSPSEHEYDYTCEKSHIRSTEVEDDQTYTKEQAKTSIRQEPDGLNTYGQTPSIIRREQPVNPRITNITGDSKTSVGRSQSERIPNDTADKLRNQVSERRRKNSAPTRPKQHVTWNFGSDSDGDSSPGVGTTPKGSEELLYPNKTRVESSQLRPSLVLSPGDDSTQNQDKPSTVVENADMCKPAAINIQSVSSLENEITQKDSILKEAWAALEEDKKSELEDAYKPKVSMTVSGDTFKVGPCGQIRKMRCKLGESPAMYVAKCINVNGDSLQSTKDFLYDIYYCSYLKHESVVKVVGITMEDDILYAFIQSPGLHNLQEYLVLNKQLTRKHQLAMALDVAKAMCYLADLDYVVQNLTTSSCWVGNDKSVKLADFSQMNDTMCAPRCPVDRAIKYRYLAPEVFVSGYCQKPSDVYAFGLLFWCVGKCGDTPYKAVRNDYDMCARLHAGERPPQTTIEAEDYSLMSDCWRTQPENRPEFQDIVIRLQNMHQASNYDTTYGYQQFSPQSGMTMVNTDPRSSPPNSGLPGSMQYYNTVPRPNRPDYTTNPGSTLDKPNKSPKTAQMKPVQTAGNFTQVARSPTLHPKIPEKGEEEPPTPPLRRFSVF